MKFKISLKANTYLEIEGIEEINKFIESPQIIANLKVLVDKVSANFPEASKIYFNKGNFNKTSSFEKKTFVQPISNEFGIRTCPNCKDGNALLEKISKVTNKPYLTCPKYCNYWIGKESIE